MPLKTGFGEYSPDQLLGFAATLKANTDGVALWTPLASQLANVEIKRAALYALMPGSGTGHTAQVNAAAAALADALSTVADDINELSAASEADRESLGLPMTRERARTTTPPGAPGNLRLRHGNQPGRVDGVCEPPGDNIRGYEAQWTLTPTMTLPGARRRRSRTHA